MMAKSKDILVDISRLRQALEEAIRREYESLENNRRTSELLIVPKWEWDNRQTEDKFWSLFNDLLPKLGSLGPLARFVKLVPNGFELEMALYQNHLDWFASFDLHIVRLERVEDMGQPIKIRFTWIAWASKNGEPILTHRRRYFYLKALLAILPEVGTALIRRGSFRKLGIDLQSCAVQSIYRLDI